MQFFSDQTLFNQKSNSNIHVTLPPSPCRLVIVLPCLLFVSSLNANMKLFESWQIAILHKARSSLQKTTLCDIHRRWCTRITTFLSLVVKFRLSSDQVRVEFGLSLGRVRFEFGLSLVEFGSISGQVHWALNIWIPDPAWSHHYFNPNIYISVPSLLSRRSSSSYNINFC